MHPKTKSWSFPNFEPNEIPHCRERIDLIFVFKTLIILLWMGRTTALYCECIIGHNDFTYRMSFRLSNVMEAIGPNQEALSANTQSLSSVMKS